MTLALTGKGTDGVTVLLQLLLCEFADETVARPAQLLCESVDKGLEGHQLVVVLLLQGSGSGVQRIP